jgi:PhnB protein
MFTINSYLTFNGNCEEAFNFYRSVFGGEFTDFNRFENMPSEQPIPEAQKQKILHVSLPINKTVSLMGCDSSETFGKATNMGNNLVCLQINMAFTGW